MSISVQRRTNLEPRENPPRALTYAALKRVSEACRRRYRRYRNVLDVGVGLKFKNGTAVEDSLCIQFCVSKKTRSTGRHRLPQYVYARHRNGSPDRRHRVATDVVVVSNARFSCAAGSQLDAPGESGTLNLLFRNSDDGLYYLLTCAHVAGDLRQSPPADPRLESDCCAGRLSAITLLNSIHSGGAVTWDIALARLEARCTPQPVLQVDGSRVPIERIRPRYEIVPGAPVECVAARSGAFAARIASDAREFTLFLDGVEYRVQNLFLIQARLQRGDSGGLVYDGSEAVGILVGIAGEDADQHQGWGLFQPLDGALEHLRENCGFPLLIFP
jgi:hypothetical protein